MWGLEDATAKPPCSGPACTSVAGSSAGPPNVIAAPGHAHVQLIGPIALTLTVYPLARWARTRTWLMRKIGSAETCMLGA